MPLTQASAGASCPGRKRPHDEQQAAGRGSNICSTAGGSPASGGKRQQPAAGGDRRGPAAEASVAQSAASAALPQQEQLPPAEQERDQQGAAPPAAAQADDEQQPAAELPPPPPKLKPRRPFAPRSFYSQKAHGGSSNADGGGGTGGDTGSGAQPSRAPTPRELYLETQVHRLLLAAKAREASWKAAEAQHGPGAQPPPEVFETFPTQQPAFERADSLGLDVFSVEYGREGKRRFIVASRSHFWQRYSGMVQRHYYEIIRAGAPCHLYFDLEFGTEDNPGVDGSAAVDALLSLLRDALRDRFGLEMQDDWALELDSSTPSKFSRHLIIRIPGAAFASNAHVGALVLQLCAAARERRHEDERCARLIVRKGEEEALFVDPAVYSRNRAFRLYLSSKAGKQTILDSTSRFGGAGLTQQELFFTSLITDVPADARLLRCFEGETSDEAVVAAGRRALSSRAGSGGSAGSSGSSGSGGSELSMLSGQQPPPGAIGAHVSYGPCPYPELEQFVCSVCCEGGVQGRVRSWVQLEDVMLFSMRDNRWCGNVGRPHKSNGIYIVVDLREGSWHQKCYDPECRHYRSPLTPLPPELAGLWQPPEEPAGGPSGTAAAAGSAAGAGAGGPAGAAAGTDAAPSGWAAASWDDEEEDCLMAEALDLFELQQAGAPAQQQQQQQQQQPAAHVLQQAGAPAQQLLAQQQHHEAAPAQQSTQQQQEQKQQPQQQQHEAAPAQLQQTVAPAQQHAPQPGMLQQQAQPPDQQPLRGQAAQDQPAQQEQAPEHEAACKEQWPAEPGQHVEQQPESAADPEDDEMLLEGLLQYERQAAAAAGPLPAVAAMPAAALTTMPAAAHATAAETLPAVDAPAAMPAAAPAAMPDAEHASTGASSTAAAQMGVMGAEQPAAAFVVTAAAAPSGGAAETAAMGPAAAEAEAVAAVAAAAEVAPRLITAAATPSTGAAATPPSSIAAASPVAWPTAPSCLRHIFLRQNKQQHDGTPLQAAGGAAAATPRQPQRQQQEQRQAAAVAPPTRKLEIWEKFL